MGRRAHSTTLVVLALGLSAGCFSSASLPAPNLPEGTRTVIVALEAADGDAQVWVMDAAEGWHPPTTAISPSVRLALYAYPTSPEQLQIPLGVQLEPRGRRRVPAAAWTAVATGVPFDRWTKDPTPRAPPTELWLPAFEWNTCLEAGGCAARSDPNGVPDLCNLDCVAPSVSAPRAPDLPGGPGWVLQPEPGPFMEEIYTPSHPPPASCPQGEVQPWGKASCEALSACDGVWPAAPGGPGATLYVSAAAAPGGDGSEQRPLSSIAGAVARSQPGDAILLDAGEHDVIGSLDIGGRQVHGVCAARTRVRHSPAGSPWSIRAADAHLEALTLPSLRVTGENLSLRAVAWSNPTAGALTLVGSSSATVRRAHAVGGDGPLFDAAEGSLRINDLVVDGASGEALRCSGGRLDLEAVALRDGGGLGVSAENCWVAARDLLLEGGSGSGIAFSAGSEAHLDDVIMRDLAGARGFGLLVSDGAQLTWKRGLVDRLGGPSITVRDGAGIIGFDLVVRDQAADQNLALIEVGTAALFELTRAYLRAPVTSALTCKSMALVTVLNDVLIDSRTAGPAPRHGVKLYGGHAEMHRVAMASSGARGLETNSRSWTRVELFDVRLHGGETGMNFEPTVNVSGERILIEETRQFGLQIGEIGSQGGDPEATFDDIVIRGAVAGPGVQVRGASSAKITRFELRDNAGVGARVIGEARLRLEGGLIRGHEVGVEWFAGAEPVFEDVLLGVRFEDNREAMRQTP